MTSPALDVPVVFIVFNRPEVTRRVFAEIARQRPRQLFIVSDGARPQREGEAQRVEQTRAITEAIDWPCEVHRNYAETNMGCKHRVSSGIDWVFNLVDRAIILEDDCLPAPAFFSYCKNMLTRYEHEQRVFAVSGSFFGTETGRPGHYFSSYSLMWGWATWRSRWQHYRVKPTDHFSVLMKTWWHRPIVLAYWLQICRRIASGALDTWDIQWILTVWRHRALACRPTAISSRTWASAPTRLTPTTPTANSGCFAARKTLMAWRTVWRLCRPTRTGTRSTSIAGH